MCVIKKNQLKNGTGGCNCTTQQWPWQPAHTLPDICWCSPWATMDPRWVPCTTLSRQDNFHQLTDRDLIWHLPWP